MAREPSAYDVVAWLPAARDPEQLAGAAFLVSRDLALTCAHVVREHLGLGEPTPTQRPSGVLRLDFRGVKQKVEAKVAPSGWWPDGGEAEIDDVAVLELLEPLDGILCPSPAIWPPNPDESCEVYGAFGRYPPPVGQTVKTRLSKHLSDRGWRQLDDRNGGEGGYLIRPGFSGSPVLDQLGNTVWGMVAAVEIEPGTRVAFAIPASTLRQAIELVRNPYERRAESSERNSDYGMSEDLWNDIERSDDLQSKVSEALAQLKAGNVRLAEEVLSEALRPKSLNDRAGL